MSNKFSPAPAVEPAAIHVDLKEGKTSFDLGEFHAAIAAIESKHGSLDSVMLPAGFTGKC